MEKVDRYGNEIGNGDYHVDYWTIEHEDVSHEVSKSETSESVYVYYRHGEASVTVRFSSHSNNATLLGDQLDGNRTCKNEILYRLGLKKRVFVPETYLFIHKQAVKKALIPTYQESCLTIQDMYDLGEGADLTEHVGKLAKGSNYLILGNKVEKLVKKKTDLLGNPVLIGKFIYE